jgi:hypothetical protein
MTIWEYYARRMRLARRIAIPLGVIFLVGSAVFQVLAKVRINSWYLAGAAGLIIVWVMLPYSGRHDALAAARAFRKSSPVRETEDCRSWTPAHTVA